MNNAYHVIAQYDDINEFFMTLEERLNRCLTSEDSYFEAFFHVPLQNGEEFQRLLMLCKQCHTIIKGMDALPLSKQTRVIEQDLRGGESYHFYEPIILLGSIHSNAYVSSSESMYVLGNVRGSVDLLHDDCTLCSANINANVRICDSKYQNVTSFSSSKVYYDTRILKVVKYKEELQWEKL